MVLESSFFHTLERLYIKEDMGELHSMSMAFTTSSLHNSSLGWDCHNNHLLGFFNTDKMSFAMDDQYMMNEPYPSPPLEHSDFSTGYLEDALVEFSERSKRRRLHEQWEVSENFDCMSQLTSSSALSGLLGDPLSAITTPMNTSDPDQAAVDSSSSSSYKETLKIRATSGDDKSSTTKKRRPAVVTRVVTPFAVVKPGGGEGEVTLNDINERILMPPTRPVRHPVGDFACRPCVSADGPGLSGKAVVALTRIHTQGRGTITIIRTKG